MELELLIRGLMIGLFLAITNYSMKSHSNPWGRWLSRFLVIGVFLLAAGSLSVFSLLATEVALKWRLIYGLLAVALWAYLIHLIRIYRKK